MKKMTEEQRKAFHEWQMSIGYVFSPGGLEKAFSLPKGVDYWTKDIEVEQAFIAGFELGKESSHERKDDGDA